MSLNPKRWGGPVTNHKFNYKDFNPHSQSGTKEALELICGSKAKKLLPCPFCGYDKIEIEQYRKDGLKIQCKRCSVKRQQRCYKFSLEWLENKMIEHWNTRIIVK